jgi:replicative DNA helicase
VNLYHYDEQAEQMILSAILQKASMLDEITKHVSKTDFFHTVHQNLFELMNTLYAKNRLDWRTVAQMVSENGDKYGEHGYISELHGALHTMYLVPHYCEKLVNLSTKRKIMDISQTLSRMVAENEYDSSDDYIAGAIQEIQKLDMVHKSEAVYLHEAIPPHIETLLSSEKQVSPKTGLADIDAWMNGIGNNRLIVLAGRPGTGKTATSLRIGREVANQAFGPTIFFSLEMSKEELMNRMLSDAATVPFADIQSRDLTEAQKISIRNAREKLSHYQFVIDDRPRMDIAYISARCRQYKREHGQLGLIVIDYLGLMEIHERKGQNRTDAIGKVTRELKLLAKEINCSILLLSQMSRDIEKRTNKRPVLSDLRDSGSIEQDADMVIFLYREEDEKQENPSVPEIDFIVAKGRQTGTKDFKLRFHGKIQRMESKII